MVLATYSTITLTNTEVLKTLRRVFYIDHPVLLRKLSVGPILILIDLSSKVNAIHPANTKKLNLIIKKTNVEAQKIHKIILKIFEIVIIAFLIHDKAKKICFFEETFLLTDISIKITLKISFLTLSNTNIHFTT